MSLIKLSNGVEISEDTIVAALEKAGIETKPPEPKHIFEAGDVAITEYAEWRFIVRVDGKTYSVNKNGLRCSTGQKDFDYYGYKFVGRLKNLLK